MWRAAQRQGLVLCRGCIAAAAAGCVAAGVAVLVGAVVDGRGMMDPLHMHNCTCMATAKD